MQVDAVARICLMRVVWRYRPPKKVDPRTRVPRSGTIVLDAGYHTYLMCPCENRNYRTLARSLR
eukprot:scaffold152983_cov34-Tisochrysis_lutea.AAC.4